MKMNLPNQLTVFRVLLVPVYVLVFSLTEITDPAARYALVAIFSLASITDFLDGNIARAKHLESDFGRFMDPLADKLLVGAAIICFVQAGMVPAWTVVIIIGREFVISGFRLVAAKKNIVIAADFWGKFKTVAQMVAIICLLLPWQAGWFRILGMTAYYLAVVLSIVSVINYIVNNPGVLKEAEK